MLLPLRAQSYAYAHQGEGGKHGEERICRYLLNSQLSATTICCLLLEEKKLALFLYR